MVGFAEPEIFTLLAHAEIPVAVSRLAGSADEGGVVLGLPGPAEVRAAADLISRLGARDCPLIVQRQHEGWSAWCWRCPRWRSGVPTSANSTSTRCWSARSARACSPSTPGWGRSTCLQHARPVRFRSTGRVSVVHSRMPP